MPKKFKPMTPEEFDRWILRRHQLDRAERRGRSTPLLVLFYGLIVPVAYLFNTENTATLQAVILTWATLAAVACVLAAFVETDDERATRYSAWLRKYDDEMQDRKREDDIDVLDRRAWYEAELSKYRERPERS